MEKILITGVGGGVGQSVIKALQATNYGLVGVDSEELATGLHSVPSAYKGCYATDNNFINRLLEISRLENCAMIFPGHDIELTPVSETVELFKAENILPIISSPEIIKICDDKLETSRFLSGHGFPVPETKRLADCTDLPQFPVVLKPQRGGARARNTFFARNAKEFDIFRSLVDVENCVVQEYIEGDEYTCGSITLDGKCHGVIVMRRILRDGDTYKAFVERNPRIETFVRDVVELLQPFGACNIQLRLRNGKPYLFEINARCSGTTAARALAGFNEPKMIADYLLHGIEPSYTIREISILRYWKELVVDNQRIADLRNTGHIVGEGIAL